jgi:uncharacterized protein YcgI (DUF1989 family)
VAPRSRQVRVDCARNEASIGGLDAEDFPPAPVVKDGVSVSFEPPLSRPGDSISFRAEMDAVVAFSACPQDLLPIMLAAEPGGHVVVVEGEQTHRTTDRGLTWQVS